MKQYGHDSPQLQLELSAPSLCPLLVRPARPGVGLRLHHAQDQEIKDKQSLCTCGTICWQLQPRPAGFHSPIGCHACNSPCHLLVGLPCCHAGWRRRTNSTLHVPMVPMPVLLWDRSSLLPHAGVCSWSLHLERNIPFAGFKSAL